MILTQKPLVLVVEDDHLILRATARALRDARLPLATAHSVEEGLSMPGPYRLAVLDLELGDGTGVELAEQLLARGVAESVLFYSATTDLALLRAAAKLGPIVSKSEGPGTVVSLARAMTRQVVEGDRGREERGAPTLRPSGFRLPGAAPLGAVKSRVG